MSQPIHRRTVLRGLGAAISLPVLEAMFPFNAFAQSLKARPTRMAFIFAPNGVDIANWMPAAEGPLGAMPSILQPFDPIKSKVNVLTGLAQHNAFALGDGPGDHARSTATWLTGVHVKKTAGSDIQAGISADQVAAHAVWKEDESRSLRIGASVMPFSDNNLRTEEDAEFTQRVYKIGRAHV